MWGNFLRRKKRDDDELAVVTRYLGSSSSNERIHTSILSGPEYVRKVLEGHEDRYKRAFRMEKHVFHSLIEYIQEKRLLQNTRFVTVEERVAIFLFCIARNASNRDLQERFQRSGETISRHFSSVLNALVQISGSMIQLPPINMPLTVSRNPKFMPYFKDCIGAIDGTHVPLTIDPKLQNPYRNRKGYLSQNVMVACDFNSIFVNVSAGWEGSASDARVLQDALDHGFYVPEGKFYLVDAGYANTPNFVAPYRGVRYHLQEQARSNARPQNAQELFNLRHAQLRNHIERIIGVLKMRFPILKCASYHPIDSQADIVLACCVLHNFIRNHQGSYNWLDHIGIDIDARKIIDVPSGDVTYRSDVQSLNMRRLAGQSKRDEIANAMWTDYVAHLERSNRA